MFAPSPPFPGREVAVKLSTMVHRRAVPGGCCSQGCHGYLVNSFSTPSVCLNTFPHPILFNPLGHNSDPRPISPSNNTACLNRQVMRINEMITKDKKAVINVKLEQILSSSTIRKVWRTLWRRCMVMQGLKGLNRGYYMAARRCEISLRVLKNISRVSAANEWSIFNTRRCVFAQKLTWYFIGV